MKEIVFPSYFRVSALNSLLKIWEDACSSHEKEILLNLRNVHFFTPFAACFLTALVGELVNQGKAGKIHFPTFLTAKHQFEYMGLPEHFSLRMPKRSSMVPTVPLQWLKKPDYDLVKQLAKLIEESLGFIAKDSLFAIRLGLKELLQNAFEHAESETGVYVCAVGIKTRRIVRICVLDRGIGIRHHLSRNPKYQNIRTDKEAIKKSIRKSVTGVRDSSRGLGLYYLSRIVEDNEGQIVIASGRSLMTFKGREVVSSKQLTNEFSGTIVEVLLKATKRYRFKLDDYEEDVIHERN